MSLILEALKKSERQRRLGESPSLGSPVMAVRRRRSLLPALIVLIAVGLAALWWIRRESALPQPGADGAASVQVDAGPAPSQPQAPTPAPVVAQSVPRAPVREQPRATHPAPMAEAETTQREKLRSGELVAANPQAGVAATIKESAPVSAADPAAIAAAMSEATKPASEPEPASAPARVPTDRLPQAGTPGAAGAPAAATDASLKLMWELPLATRRSLPELKLSMHVFAAQPDQRFVIINGERRAQGDEFEGLKLVEIRSDGIVLEHEGVRFLYPRGGR